MMLSTNISEILEEPLSLFAGGMIVLVILGALGNLAKFLLESLFGNSKSSNKKNKR